MIERIVTHDGRFHADEILACAIIQLIYGDLNIIRTRDFTVIQNYINKKGTIVVDVYDNYNHEKLLYDHHQRGFNETYDSAHKTKLSSSGLIFKHYSKKLFETFVEDKTLMKNEKMVALLIEEIYEEYFEAIDALDNGIDVKSDILFRGLEKIVSDYNCGLNPRTNDQTFVWVLGFVKKDLSHYMKNKIRCLALIDVVSGYMWKDRTKSILYVEDIKMPVPIVRRLEKINGEDFKFIINRDLDKYTIYPVPKEMRGFNYKKRFNEKWLGLKGASLQNASGVSDAIFVHKSGFLAETKTLEGAYKMCYQCMKY